MVRHHQRPGRQRHELPRDQEGEGVVGEHDEIHAGEKGRIERQHALRRLLVAAVAEREQARGGGAEIDHGQKERRRAHRAEMRAEPWQAERKRHGRRRLGEAEQRSERDHEQRQRGDQADAVDDRACARGIPEHDGDGRGCEEHGDANKGGEHRRHQSRPSPARAPCPAMPRGSVVMGCPLSSSVARRGHRCGSWRPRRSVRCRPRQAHRPASSVNRRFPG